MSGYIAPQQPIQPQPPLQPVYQEEKGLTVCGIVGVVFGALGFVLSFIPIINNIAAIFGFIGVILAIVATQTSSRWAALHLHKYRTE